MRQGIRLLVFLGILAILSAGASVAWAQQPDPLHIGSSNTPAALEGSYITGSGQFQWLILGSPQLCNDGSDATDCPNSAHVWFYSAACSRIDDKLVPLTENDVRVLPLHVSTTTSNRVGNFLVAATPPGGPFDQPLLASNAIIGYSIHIDLNRGLARREELARLSGNSGNKWTDYKPAAVILLALPDDGTTVFETLLVRCPVGTATQVANGVGGTVLGTQGTLGGDMLDLASQDAGNAPGSVFDKVTTAATASTICDDCDSNGTFAAKLSANVFDTEEEFQQSVDNLPCRCIGVDPTRTGTAANFVNEVRLSALSGVAATIETYWEIFSFGGSAGDELFAASKTTRITGSGFNLYFHGRLHNARDRDNIEF